MPCWSTRLRSRNSISMVRFRFKILPGYGLKGHLTLLFETAANKYNWLNALKSELKQFVGYTKVAQLSYPEQWKIHELPAPPHDRDSSPDQVYVFCFILISWYSWCIFVCFAKAHAYQQLAYLAGTKRITTQTWQWHDGHDASHWFEWVLTRHQNLQSLQSLHSWIQNRVT